MNINRMKKVFSVAHKAKRSVKMVGPHGIGKSQVVTAWGEENGFHVEVLQLPLMDEGDLMGIPVTTERNGETVTTWAKPVWLQRIHTAGEEGIPSVLFLDELGRASAGIRQVALQLVLENRLQEYTLGEINGLPTLKIVADNPSEDYDTAEYDAALESRFMSFEVDSSVDDFLEYGRKADILPVITDYIAEYSDKLRYSPKDETDKGSNPRSWEFLSDSLKACDDEELVFTIIQSEIGQVVGANFFNFYNNYIDIIKPKDIYDAIEGDLDTEKNQRANAETLKELTSDMEVLAAQELAEKLMGEVQEKKNDQMEYKSRVLLVYIASLKPEIATSILKTWKLENGPRSKWYFEVYPEIQPNKWFAKEVHKIYKAGKKA